MASLRTLAESGYAVLIVEHRLEQVLPFVHEVWRLRNGSLERQTGREALRAAPPETAEHIHAEARREEPVMTLRSVGWRAGGRSILEGVDLTLFQGERLLLLGDNGCGKTSLLRLIARLARPTVGEIRQLIDPALGQRRGSRAWFRRVGVVYQNPNCQLFMPTVAQEVAFAAKSEDFAREIMELFGIAHLAERHPHSLSEGQKRRVSIAAVAASQPELLLLDEPTVGQDREGLRTLLHALNLLHTRTGNTIVTVTHDRRCASALCDRAAWLKDGRIEKTGGPELIEAAWGDSAAM
ncbi:MAG: energy-coupling factor ABC transporter ATP-binding protein [Vescimonas sp.]